MSSSTPTSTIVQALMEAFPLAFTLPTRPLKRGVLKDLFAAELPYSKEEIRRGVADWVRRSRYLHAIEKGGPRFDLHGEPCGQVEDAERAYSREQLERRHGAPKRSATSLDSVPGG